MTDQWRVSVTISATSQEDLSAGVAAWASEITKAKSYRDYWQVNVNSRCGVSGRGFSYNTTCEGPIEERIADLRREADALEQSLGAKRS